MLQPAQGLSRIGRDHVDDLVKARRRPVPFLVRPRNLNPESSFHGQIANCNFHQLLQLAGTLVALFGKQPRRGQIGLARTRQLTPQPAQHLVFVLHLGKLAGDIGPKGDHVIKGGVVLALQAIDGGQPVLDLRKMFRRSVNPARVIAHRGAYILDADQRRFQRRKGFLKFGLVARQLLNLLPCRPQRGARRDIAFIQKIERIHRRVVDLFRIREDALLVLQPLVFARLELRVVDFALLIAPKVEQAKTVLLVMLELLNARPDSLPGVEGVVNTRQVQARERIQQGEPRRPIKGSQRLILRVHGREVWSQLLQHRHGRGLVINEDAAFAASRNFAPQDDRFILRIEAIVFEDSRNRLGRAAFNLEHGGDDGALCSSANDIGRSLIAEQQRQCIDEDGLAGTRFARKQIQPRRELYCQVVDDRVVFKAQFEEHGFPEVRLSAA